MITPTYSRYHEYIVKLSQSPFQEASLTLLISVRNNGLCHCTRQYYHVRPRSLLRTPWRLQRQPRLPDKVRKKKVKNLSINIVKREALFIQEVVSEEVTVHTDKGRSTSSDRSRDREKTYCRHRRNRRQVRNVWESNTVVRKTSGTQRRSKRNIKETGSTARRMGRHTEVRKNFRDMNNITKTKKTLIGNLFSNYSKFIRNL